ncbi:GNAT family N-acetyltransferase [Marinobacterium arenosum]|uniref:GNAT family N-acetyltransferase n=1 Tax=Marinobacterium arenosum TaxID=2862496 RepID=UPI001C94E68F|nr:GNAT family N-acetyltransferase [Marinobacterium arenosum]MBY4678977.1 GNAT family N-acetyltransferase [Marinobacterium arenosum]
MATSQQYRIQAFEPRYTDQVTELWRVSMQQAIGIPPLHSFESQAYFLRELLPQSHRLFVAIEIETGESVGFMAADSKSINQLYIHIDHQNRGLGRAFVELAKGSSEGSLQLRTFEVNKNAQRFYQRHGFKAIGGDCDNEEGLPDILYQWRAVDS